MSSGLKLAALLAGLREHNGSQAHLKADISTVRIRGRLLSCILKKLAFCTLGERHRWTSSWDMLQKSSYRAHVSPVVPQK